MTYTNPIAYGKRIMATDVDACNAVGMAATGTTLYNGTLVTLGSLGTGAAANKGYVYPVTPTTANTAVDVWMVVAPAVNREVSNNLYIDPRTFEIPAGRPADLVRPMPSTDSFQVSIYNFTDGSDPETVSGAKYATADANGKLKAVTTATAVTGIVFAIQDEEDIPVGQEMVKGWILKCVQNPAVALA